MAAPRAISLASLLLSVVALGGLLGTILYWIKANREDDQLEAVMSQKTYTTDPKAGMSVDITAPPPAALNGIPPYPRAVPKRVSENMKGQGSQLAVAWFTTDDPVDNVLEFYEAAFRERKHFPVSHRYSDRSGYVGWLEPKGRAALDEDAGFEMFDGVMHLVSAMKEGQKTAVLLSASRPMQLLDAKVQLPSGVEMPPFAEDSKVFDLGDGERKQTTVWSEVHDRPAAEIETWFSENLKQHGWTIADHASGPARTAVDYKREKEHLSVVLTPSGANIGLMVQYGNQPQSLTEGF